MIEILILEDDLVDQMALTRAFDKNLRQAKITICTNISQVQNKLKLKKFDWVIADFNLPDGTIQDILSFARQTKMICVSGQLEPEKITELMQAGLHKYLLKDQHLNYLKCIIGVITSHLTTNKNDYNVPKQDELNQADLNNQLEKFFDTDTDAKIEVLEIFIDQTIQNDFPLLTNAIAFKQDKKVHHLAHKIQSSFRLFNAPQVLKILYELENLSKPGNIDWERIKTLFAQLQSDVQKYTLQSESLLKVLKS